MAVCRRTRARTDHPWSFGTGAILRARDIFSVFLHSPGDALLLSAGGVMDRPFIRYRPCFRHRSLLWRSQSEERWGRTATPDLCRHSH
jgi:hypothetical protein